MAYSAKSPGVGSFVLSGRFRLDRLQLTAFFIAMLVLAPLGVVLSSVFSQTNGVWQHLVHTVLGELLLNTLWLVLGVGVGTTLLGVSLAWLTAACDFPGRRLFDWALMLPLAIPAYVTAFVGIGLLDFTGPVQTHLRMWLGEGHVWFPKIRSTGGVILIMTLALYPYVYLLVRNAFLTQGKRAVEAAQSLGYGRWSGFFKVSLPMAQPWIAGGLMLALMETLADFGAVSIFNYDTFTTAIYKAWFGLFSLPAAAQLSSLLVLIVFVVLMIEQQLRSRMRYVQIGKSSIHSDRIVLRHARGWFASAYCTWVLMVAFVIPVVQLLIWAYNVFDQDFDSRYLGFLSHSLLLGGIAALLITACALILVYANRHHHFLTRIIVKIATLGYALPGSVLAVGVFIVLAWLDNQIMSWGRSWFNLETGFLINGTLAAMILAYLVRFLAVAYNPIESAMQRITPSVDEAATSLGSSGIRLLQRVHLPILRGGLLTAATLVFVDVMKEMPMTLMTRPFGWDTLSIRIFEMTSEGEWERAALPAVALVLAGLIPIMALTKQSSRVD
ncbi:MAG: iron ABC transporter permease [Nitrospira sp.]|nr:iron ABC transporter permease [Nitrospira sp.]